LQDPEDQDMTENLVIEDGRNWRFSGAPWADRPGNGGPGVPADVPGGAAAGLQGYHFAFYRRYCLSDCTIRFEFRHDGFSDVGLILRAQGMSRFHFLHFPYVGQANNTQNFWAALSRMEESGWMRTVKLELVRREPANREIWHPVELTLKGRGLHVRVGRCGLFAADDESLPARGFVGLGLFNSGCIRNVTLEAEPLPDQPWNDQTGQPANWFHPEPAARHGRRQWPDDLIRLSDGTLLLSYIGTVIDDRGLEQKSTPLLLRSADGGRSWAGPDVQEPAPGRLHVTPGGRLIALDQAGDAWYESESRDNARTWSGRARLPIRPWPAGFDRFYSQSQVFLNLVDGGILLFAYGQQAHADVNVREWGALHGQAFCCRSDDDGRTWSDWISLDNSAQLGVSGQQNNRDLTETCAAQTGDGSIFLLARPIYSPWMWETWSQDGGRTWGPCARGPFPGYATANMLRTTSGRLVVAHRLPGLTLHTSPDDGQTWDSGTMIDSSIWAMGSMIETEPDRVLYVYRDSFESLMRACRFRVTADGIEPLSEEVVSRV
jgi:hypothetical protein